MPTRLAPLARSTLLSPLGKARVALDYLLPARRAAGDESLGGFIRRRLGREAWERLVEPLMAGIYAADGDQLSLAATFPQLREAERRYGGLIKGVLAARRQAPAPVPAPGSAFLTPAAGLDDASRRVGEAAPGRRSHARTRRPGHSRDARSGSAFDVRLAAGDSIQADAVIVATPAYAAADLLADLDPVLAAELDAIPHASTAIVTLAYRREEISHPLDGHGYVIPRAEGSPILACTWSSRKWAGRAPEGWELIRVFIGRAGQEDVLAADDETLVALAVKRSRRATWRDRSRLVDSCPPLAAWHAAVSSRSSGASRPDRGCAAGSTRDSTSPAMRSTGSVSPIALRRASAPRTPRQRISAPQVSSRQRSLRTRHP